MLAGFVICPNVSVCRGPQKTLDFALCDAKRFDRPTVTAIAALRQALVSRLDETECFLACFPGRNGKTLSTLDFDSYIGAMGERG